MKNLTFQEKSLWICLIATVTTYVLYYLNVLPPVEGNMQMSHIVQFFSYIGVLVAFIVIGQIIITVKYKDEPADERQQLIELKADRTSAYILHIGIFIAIIVALKVPGNYWFIHTINFAAVLTEVINQIQQLRAFRRGF
jgi:cytochrome b561